MSTNVRRARFELACALAAAESPRRGAEALEELERTLTEHGQDPSDGRVHLEAARLYESIDPAEALRRYLQAVDDQAIQETATLGALDVLTLHEDLRLGSTMPYQLVDRVRQLAADRGDSSTALLAGGLLRQRGRSEEALELLRAAKAADAEAQCRLSRTVATTLLDLDRLDELIDYAGSQPPDLELSSMLVQAHLVLGAYDQVLRIADSHLWPAAAAMPAMMIGRALALAGIGQQDEAATLLDDLDTFSAKAARAVVALIQRDYPAARAAAQEFLRLRLTDPDALVLEAQVALESLGVDRSGTEPAGQELDNARRLVSEAVAHLPVPYGQLWWFRVQRTLRRQDGRFHFYVCELRHAVDDPVPVEELAAVDRTTTTYLQDAALAERIAELRGRGQDEEATADAYSEAGSLWQRSESEDAERAYQAHLAAYTRAPNGKRAIDLAYAQFGMSYLRDADPSETWTMLQSALEQLRTWRGALSAEDVHESIRATAWLKGRLAELATADRISYAADALPWLLVATAFQPGDASIKAMLTSTVRTLGLHRVATAFAEQLISLSDDIYSLSTAITVILDRGDAARVQQLLATESIDQDPGWKAGIAAVALLFQGRAADVLQLFPGSDTIAWIQAYFALAKAMVHGIPAARPDIQAALEASPVSLYSYGDVLMAGVLQDREWLHRIMATIEADHNVNEHELARCRRLARFATDPGFEADDFVRQTLAEVSARGEIDELLSFEAPLLIAGRQQSTEPPPVLKFDDPVLHEQLRRFEEAPAGLPEQFDALTPGLARLALLASDVPVTSYSDAETICAELDRYPADPELQPAIEEIQQEVRSRAIEGLPSSLLAWRVGRVGSFDAAGVSAALAVPAPDSLTLTLAVLGGPAENTLLAELLPQADAGVGTGVQDGILSLAREMTLSRDEWWRLDDALGQISSANPDTDTQRFVERLRTELLSVLSQVLGFDTAPTHQRLSNFAFALGSNLIPDDTSSTWSLFSTLIPAMREHILAETGFKMPGCSVRGDYLNDNALWLFINGSPLETHRLPEPDLELAIQRVERFAREHLPELLAPWHVEIYVSELGSQLADTVLTDPIRTVRWLDELRSAAGSGRSLDPAELAPAVAARDGLGSTVAVSEAR